MNNIKPKDRDKYHLLPKTQVDAKTHNTNYYFTGEPCKNGHVSVRSVLSRSCYECIVLNNRKKHRQYNHKCTEAEVETLLVKQKKMCGICGSFLVPKFHVDHNHAPGFVRGLLCSHCNFGLGQFRDDEIILQAAIKYLKQPPTKFLYKR
jgi:hypothetical protein